MDFVTPVVEHWLEREIAQWIHHEGGTLLAVFVIAAVCNFRVKKLSVIKISL